MEKSAQADMAGLRSIGLKQHNTQHRGHMGQHFSK